jgi:hypothetical protein
MFTSQTTSGVPIQIEGAEATPSMPFLALVNFQQINQSLQQEESKVTSYLQTHQKNKSDKGSDGQKWQIANSLSVYFRIYGDSRQDSDLTLYLLFIKTAALHSKFFQLKLSSRTLTEIFVALESIFQGSVAQQCFSQIAHRCTAPQDDCVVFLRIVQNSLKLGCVSDPELLRAPQTCSVEKKRTYFHTNGDFLAEIQFIFDYFKPANISAGLYELTSNQFRERQLEGGDRMNAELVRDAGIALPADIEQVKITEFIDRFDSLKACNIKVYPFLETPTLYGTLSQLIPQLGNRQSPSPFMASAEPGFGIMPRSLQPSAQSYVEPGLANLQSWRTEEVQNFMSFVNQTVELSLAIFAIDRSPYVSNIFARICVLPPIQKSKKLSLRIFFEPTIQKEEINRRVQLFQFARYSVSPHYQPIMHGTIEQCLKVCELASRLKTIPLLIKGNVQAALADQKGFQEDLQGKKAKSDKILPVATLALQSFFYKFSLKANLEGSRLKQAGQVPILMQGLWGQIRFSIVFLLDLLQDLMNQLDQVIDLDKAVIQKIKSFVRAVYQVFDESFSFTESTDLLIFLEYVLKYTSSLFNAVQESSSSQLVNTALEKAIVSFNEDLIKNDDQRGQSINMSVYRHMPQDCKVQLRIREAKAATPPRQRASSQKDGIVRFNIANDKLLQKMFLEPTDKRSVLREIPAFIDHKKLAVNSNEEDLYQFILPYSFEKLERRKVGITHINLAKEPAFMRQLMDRIFTTLCPSKSEEDKRFILPLINHFLAQFPFYMLLGSNWLTRKASFMKDSDLFYNGVVGSFVRTIFPNFELLPIDGFMIQPEQAKGNDTINLTIDKGASCLCLEIKSVVKIVNQNVMEKSVSFPVNIELRTGIRSGVSALIDCQLLCPDPQFFTFFNYFFTENKDKVSAIEPSQMLASFSNENLEKFGLISGGAYAASCSAVPGTDGFESGSDEENIFYPPPPPSSKGIAIDNPPKEMSVRSFSSSFSALRSKFEQPSSAVSLPSPHSINPQDKFVPSSSLGRGVPMGLASSRLSQGVTSTSFDCANCTFQNSPGVPSCEICGMQL